MADLSTYPQAPFLIPPPPEKITATTTHPENDVTTSKLAPEQTKLHEDLSTLRNQQIDDALAKSEHDKEVAEAKAADAKAQADEYARQQEEHAKAYEQTQNEITQWSTRLKEARDRYDNAPTPKLFHEGDTYGNVMKALAVGLSGAADAMRARIAVMTGRDQGPSAVDAIINGDLDRQREKIKMMKDKAVMAEAGLNDAQEARKLLLAEVDARGAVAFKRVVLIGKANLEAQGKTQADIDANETIAKAQKEMLDAQGRAVDGMTQKIVKQGKDITITENENKPDKSKGPTASEIQLSPTDIFNVNGDKIGEASTPKLADELMHGNGTTTKGALPAYADLRDALKRLRDHEEKYGATIDPTKDEFRVRDQLYNDALVMMKGPAKDALGVPTGPDVGIIEGQIGGSLASKAGMGVAKLDAAIDKLDRDAARGLASHGFKNPKQLLQQYRGEAPAPASPAMAPPTMFVPKQPLSGPVTRDELAAGKTGPVAKDSPEDVNSQAPLPEDPGAQSIDDFQPKVPKRSPGVAGLKSVPTPTPAQPAAPAANPVEDLRARTIRKLKANPNLPGAKVVMKQLGITDEDLR